MTSSFLPKSIVAFFMLGSSVFAQDWKAHATRVDLGYILGCSEAAFLDHIISGSGDAARAELYMFVDQELCQGYGTADNRFHMRALGSDLVFLYAGQTVQINEIYDLARKGLLLPLDSIPDIVEKLKLSDFYPNLMRPVQTLGHTWAVPFRVCPPALGASDSGLVSAGKWTGVADAAGRFDFAMNHPSDPYLLWRSILLAGGKDIVDGKKYFLEPARAESTFNAVLTLFNDKSEWPEADLGMIVPDSIINNPELRELEFTPLPENNSPVYTPENVWYIGVSSTIMPEKIDAAVTALNVLTGTEVQTVISHMAFSPPVRPSIANSAEYKATFPQDSIQRVLSETVPRLQFRKGGPGWEEAEEALEAAFNRALEDPENFLPLITAAVNEANNFIE